MLVAVILYSLAVYFAFHLASRADILAKPRAWVFRKLPSWLVYPLTCAFCFTFWLTLGSNLLGFIATDLIVLLAAPVVNMVLDLIVRALIRANEPPLVKVESPGLTFGTDTYVGRGPDVTVSHGDGYKIYPSDPWWKTLGGTSAPAPSFLGSAPLYMGDSHRFTGQLDSPFNPLDHEQTK